ncbi:MAG: glycosyltransferase family 39 protein [Acidobacteriota bacterium]
MAWFNPAFLKRTSVRAAIVAILLIKIAAVFAVQQQGWCVTFDPPRPMVRDSTGRPHAWDVRADWLADDPKCSAVMTDSYRDTFEVPAWFFNLPPPDDAVVRTGFHPGDIPIRIAGTGYLTVRSKGTFELLTTAPMAVTMRVDGLSIAAAEPGRHRAELPRGTHLIQFDGTMLGKQWRAVPQWNGTSMGSMLFPLATMAPLSMGDRIAYPAFNWILLILIAALIAGWIVATFARLRTPMFVIWMGAIVAVIAIAAVYLPEQAAWYSFGLAAVVLTLPIPRRLMTARGVCLLIGVPWLAFLVAMHAHEVGRWTLYGIGNDNFLFQRFSYRVFMQHFWLEGGQLTFWNQPMYRWIAGVLHMIFGDSSVGQLYSDGAAVLVMMLFAYRVVRPSAGFTWGLLAAMTPLAMFLVGPALEFVGFGLSEISSAGFIYLAAFFAMRNRGARDAVIAGVLVTLGFFTRLNNLPMAVAVAAFALPITLAAGDWWRPRSWLPLVRWRVVAGIAGALVIGGILFAWRTWYYTGVFGLFYGTQRQFLAVWKPEMSWQQALPAMGSSLMMLLTGQDPPRFAWYASPLLGAAAISVGAVAGLPVLREAPLAVVAFFLAGCSGALVTRGWGHEGRFSIHLYGSAAAVCGWAIAAVSRKLFGRNRLEETSL